MAISKLYLSMRNCYPGDQFDLAMEVKAITAAESLKPPQV